jgi:hypothetical protein
MATPMMIVRVVFGNDHRPRVLFAMQVVSFILLLDQTTCSLVVVVIR